MFNILLNNIQVIFNEYYLFVQSSGSAQEDDRITLRITEDADYASNKGQYVALNLGIPQNNLSLMAGPLSVGEEGKGPASKMKGFRYRAVFFILLLR